MYPLKTEFYYTMTWIWSARRASKNCLLKWPKIEGTKAIDQGTKANCLSALV